MPRHPEYTDAEIERGFAFMESGGSKSCNYRIPADLMPRRMDVKKSTVQLLVAGVPWGEDVAPHDSQELTEKKSAGNGVLNVYSNRARREPSE